MISAVVAGNLGKDAELKDTKAGPVLSFSVASSSKQNGEKQTTWIRVSLFGKRGQALAQYLTKGTKVCVSGELSAREYNGKTYLELRASEIELMGGGERSAGNHSERPASKGGGYGSDYDPQPSDDDLPF